MLVLFILTFLIEMLLYVVPFAWKYRRPISIALIIIILAMILTFINRIELGAWLLLGLLSIFRIVNLLRIVKNRTHEQYLRVTACKTTFWIFMFHALALIGIALPLSFDTLDFWRVLGSLQLLTATGLIIVTCKNVIKLRFQTPQTYLTDKELPTVTVAIPARNETTELEACLQSVLANDYPKLEVLVLDDCSQTKTAEIIRSFAHNGVRFIKGQEPARRWLAKNQAYQKLYESATGELILFCGVDARFGAQSIRGMVNLLAARKKSMISVLPIRRFSSAASAFIQPVRYWWELALPRRWFNKPAVLSTCWLIGRQDVKDLGGFAAVSHNILPERYFAREMIKTDQYSFVRSSAELQVETVKNFQQQYATALRTRYPQVKRRPEWILLLTLFHVLFLLMPFMLLLLSPWWHPIPRLLPLMSCFLLIAVHVLIVTITDPANSLIACITFPLAVMVDIYVMYSSMIRYEFFEIEWKERNICIPIMHVITHLPQPDPTP